MMPTSRQFFLRIACVSILAASSLRAQDNPDPTSDQVTSFTVTQNVPAGSAMDPAWKLPHRDSYLMIPDRTGQIKLNVSVTHTYTGAISTVLVDNHGVLMHNFGSTGSGTFNINVGMFNGPYHLFFVNPSGEYVDQRVIVTPGNLKGRDGPGFVGTPSSFGGGIQMPPGTRELSLLTYDSSDESDNGEDGSGSCPASSCSACDQSTPEKPNETDEIRVDDHVGETTTPEDGSFSTSQPAGTSANGDSMTTLDAMVDPGDGISQANVQVHGNGDATVTRNGSNQITSVETSSTYSKVETVTTSSGPSVKISQWKTKTQADNSEAPYRTVLFENTASNQLKRTSTFNSHSVETIWRYTFGTQKTWELVSGGGLRREELIREDDGTDPAKKVLRRKLYERAAGASGEAAVLVSEIRQTFIKQDFGWKKTKLEVFGLTNNPLVTEWDYWPGNGSSNGKGLLKRYARPDGFTQDFNYAEASGEFTMTVNSSPLGNTSPVQEGYSSNSSGTSQSYQKSIDAMTVTSSETTWPSATEFSIQTYNGISGIVDTAGKVYAFGADHGGKCDASTNAASGPDYGETAQYTRGTNILTILHKRGKMTSGAVTDGTVTEVMVDKNGVAISRLVYDIPSNVVLESVVVDTFDAVGRPTKVDYFPGGGGPLWSEQMSYDCCGLSSLTDRNGIVTTYSYDSLKRLISEVSRGITRQTVYDGLVIRTKRSAGSLGAHEIANSERNLAGTRQITRKASPQSAILAGTSVTATYRNPEGPTPNPDSLPAGIGKRVVRQLALVADDNTILPKETTDYFFDGRPYETTGNLGTNIRYNHAVTGFDSDGNSAPDTNLYTVTTYRLDGATQKEYSQVRTDWTGKTVTSASFGNGATRFYYDADGLLVKTVDADGAIHLYDYNGRHERTIEARDLDGDGNIDYGDLGDGTDQVTFTETRPLNDGTRDLVRTTRKVWKPGAGVGSPTVVSYDESTPDGLQSWSRAFPTTGSGYGVSHSVRTVGSAGDWTVTDTGNDNTIFRSYFDNGYLVAETLWAAGSTPPGTAPSNIMSVSTSGFVAGNAYGYDDLGRGTTAIDSRAGTVTTAYISAACDYTLSVTDAGGRVTSYTYDHRGRTKTADSPDTPNPAGGNFTNVVTTTHYSDDSVQDVSGSAYPVSYTYDYARRMKTMATSGRTTTWNYDANGHLEQKLYPDGPDAGSVADPGPSYTYTAAGRVKKRIWGSGKTTRYDYATGRLYAQRYFTSATSQSSVDSAGSGNDSTTPDLVYTLDALGRTTAVSRGGSSHFTYTYDANDLGLKTETQNDAAYEQRLLTRKRDGILRSSGYKFGTTADDDAFSEVSYGYDTAGRFSTVAYQRTPGASSPPAVMTFNYVYDYEQGTGVHTAFDGSGTAKPSLIPFRLDGPSHNVMKTYEENRDGLVSISNLSAEGSVHNYGLNALGQRTGVVRKGADMSTTIAAIDWQYDSKGQVIAENSSAAGGTADDRYFAYDGIGNRTLSATGSTTSSGGTNTTYFGDATALAPGGNSLNQYGAIVRSGNTYNPVYDADGNMTDNGQGWTFGWDGENRMISATPATVALGKAVYKYDHLGRLVTRETHHWNGSAWAFSHAFRYVYDGWNRIESWVNWTQFREEYVWGLDLSGTQEGAGGVGGMLMWICSKDYGVNWDYLFPLYDGNGNVTELLGLGGDIKAHWEYDAFGNTLRSTAFTSWDEPVSWFEFRFSTKPLMAAGLYYYGYRFYDPVTGRWPSRDPLQEMGGPNLYGFSGNNGVAKIDPLGLRCNETTSIPASETMVPTTTSSGGAASGVGSSIIGRGAGIGAGFLLSYMMLEADMMRAQAENWGIPEPYSIFTGTGYPYGEQAVRNFSAKNKVEVTDETIEDHRMATEVAVKQSKVFHKSCESKDEKTKCRFIWDTQKLGNYPPHDAYTSRLFRPDYELVVQAPDGDSARYDGGYPFPGPVTGVIEAKTGRRWVGMNQSKYSPVQRNIYARDIAQFERQARVAKKCNLSYAIYFQEDAGAKGYQQQQPHLAPNVKHVP